VDCSHVVLDPLGRTGFMFKGRVTDGSDPPTEYHRAGSAASQFKPEQVDVDWLCRARHLHVTGVFPALSQGCFDATVRAMDATRAACKTVSFDPNLCPALWTSQALMCERVLTLSARAHWVLPGLQEGRLLTGQTTAQGVARALRARGADVVAVKLAAAGAYADSASWTGEVAGWPVAHVVDTVGAGDAFAVGLISALLDGRTLAAALTRGTWRGSLAVQVVGDTEGLPRRAQLDAAGL
jgi:2-dehydro-3-deoxygluconokinase